MDCFRKGRQIHPKMARIQLFAFTLSLVLFLDKVKHTVPEGPNQKALKYDSAVLDLPRHTHWTNDSDVAIIQINRCNLETIDRESLSNLPQLRSLYLESNRIEHIHPMAFCNNQLVELDLSFNLLTTFNDDGTFPTNPHLETLVLSRNNIDFENLVFPHNANIRYLTCQSCNMIRITFLMFHNLAELTTLNLSSNRISFVSENAFQDNKKLLSINLNHNNIKTITISSPSLTRLNLEDALQLTTLDLRNLPKLEYLNAQVNRIKTILPPTNSYKLKRIYLDYNRIRILPNITRYPNLTVLCVDDNELQPTSAQQLVEYQNRGLREGCPFLIRPRDRFENYLAGIEHGVALYRHRGDKRHTIKHITLADSDIVYIKPSYFAGRDEITSLNLDNNANFDFRNGVPFPDIPNLQKLSMRACGITLLFLDTFKGVPALKSLNLAHNLIPWLPVDKPFFNLTKLEFLDLSYNRLTTFEWTYFQFEDTLKTLNLSGNQFKVLALMSVSLQLLFCQHCSLTHHFAVNIRTWLPNIRELHLAHNNISDFDAAIFRSSSLRVLDLHANPLTRFDVDPANLENITKLCIDARSVRGDALLKYSSWYQRFEQLQANCTNSALYYKLKTYHVPQGIETFEEEVVTQRVRVVFAKSKPTTSGGSCTYTEWTLLYLALLVCLPICLFAWNKI